MKIIQGNSTYFTACIKIAAGLPQYFTSEGIANLSKDIRDHQLFLVVEPDSILGFITINNKNSYVAEISWLAVRFEYQYKGYGTAMLNYVVEDLKRNDVKLLEVKTLSSAVDYAPYELTRRFYEKSGFLLIDTIDPYPGWDPGSPCAIYVKIL